MSGPRDFARLPRHVAIIMDGNGRWAENRDRPRLEGHREGAHSVRDVVRAAREIGLEAITLYAFSAQNWGRPPDEIHGLMELLRDYVIEERSEIMDNGIRLAAIGEVERLPPFVAEPLAELMADSAGNSDMVLTLALSYGGRESICRAVTELIASGATGPVTEQELESFLPTAGLPPLDLLIRTSGEVRISNFLLWEAAYAELVFSDALWPEFRREQLFAAIDTYNRRQRRFGLTGKQVESGGDLAP